METGFGWVELRDTRYDHDVVVHTDRSVEKRSKKKSKELKGQYGGHTPLADHELKFLKKERPEVVFIGTGQYGDLPITDEANKILARYEAVILPTPAALAAMAGEERPYAAILHVTC